MWPRRKFLKAGALASASAVAAPWTQFAAAGTPEGASSQGGRHYVLVDETLAASAEFARTFDPRARIARAALLTQWSQLQQALASQGSISGVTRHSDLPLAMQLVTPRGARLVFEDAHQVRAAGFSASLDWAQALAGKAAPHRCNRMGELPEVCRSGVASHIAAPPADSLVGWALVYGAA